MLTLYLVRHAETFPGAIDFERKLTPEGETQAREMGLSLKKHRIKPDQILSSPAIRAVTTAKLIAKSLGKKVHTESSIYNADVETLLAALGTLTTEKSVLLVAHNPGISLLANYLANVTLPAFSPCDLCILEIPAENWQSLTAHSGTIRAL